MININILYCGDKNTIDGLIISLLSLTKHTDKSLNIYILTMRFNNHEPLEEKEKVVLEKILKDKNKKSNLFLIDTTRVYESCIPRANIDTRFTPYCMLRLYIDLLENMPDKILYLDYDVVCNKDFSSFYDMDISAYSIAGVLDYYGSHLFREKIFTKDYLNSGVLLLNMPLIKANNIFAKAREMCQNKKMLMPDQSALNKVCKDKLILPRKYNEQHTMHDDTVFRHFTTTFKFFPKIKTQTIKPWHIDNLHNVLHTYEFDDILEKYLEIKGEYDNE